MGPDMITKVRLRPLSPKAVETLRIIMAVFGASRLSSVLRSTLRRCQQTKLLWNEDTNWIPPLLCPYLVYHFQGDLILRQVTVCRFIFPFLLNPEHRSQIFLLEDKSRVFAFLTQSRGAVVLFSVLPPPACFKVPWCFSRWKVVSTLPHGFIFDGRIQTAITTRTRRPPATRVANKNKDSKSCTARSAPPRRPSAS